jgi:TolB-like protein/Tfp pilus assembly protein PilF
VLPLRNISPDPNDEYFADGMTEELISALSRVEGLRVIARTSAMRYKGREKSVAEIGRELGVRSILEGSVRKSGDRLRITVLLVDAASEEPLWSEDYDRRLEDVFAIQREIARNIVESLKLQIAARGERRLDPPETARVDAYTLYLKGRRDWNLRTSRSLQDAVTLFDQALGEDPKFVLAWAGLADAYAALAMLEFAPPTEAFPKARAAAEKALALDDRSAEAHASLGLVRFQYERDWVGAERELRRAVELNPNYPAAHQFLADLLKALGRFEESTSEMRSALELDPFSMAINTGLGHVLYLSRRFDDSIAQYRKALEIDPTFMLAHLWFGRPYLQEGRFDEAIAEVRQAVRLSGGSTMALAMLAHSLASAGRAGEAREILEQLLERARTHYLPSYWIALIYTGMGDDPQALHWLERAYEERSAWVVWIGVEPRFDRLRATPGFVSLLERMRLGREVPGSLPADRARVDQTVATFLTGLSELDPSRYRVVGHYARYDEEVRHDLKDLRLKIVSRLAATLASRDNFLLWGAPGTGKTFFVRELAGTLGTSAKLVELNLAELGEREFRAGLTAVREAVGPTLCFVDEADSKPGESWPYESMLPSLDLGGPPSAPRVFVLAGSSGESLDGMIRLIAGRTKGTDLLSRIPQDNLYAIPPMSPEDRLLVAASTLQQSARRLDKPVAEVEKLALYFLAATPELANPRQLRDLLTRAMERLPPGEERLKFDYLFAPGDVESKEFWGRARAQSPGLVNSFLRLAE